LNSNESAVYPEQLRWSLERKAVLLLAIDCGQFSSAEARERYLLSDEELAA
jgi:hypothetical protein